MCGKKENTITSNPELMSKLLKEARNRYPIGTKFTSFNGAVLEIFTPLKIKGDTIVADGGDICSVVLWKNGVWAQTDNELN